MEYKVRTQNSEIHLDGIPDKCPFCHRLIRPVPIYAYNFNTNGKWIVLMNCPNSICQESFIAYYQADKKTHPSQMGTGKPYFLGQTSVGNLATRDFPDTIVEVSTEFVKIYNESYSAEQHGLTEICGVGYRKALEFLIKDYVVKKHPADKDKIEKKMLASCIADYVTDDRIKAVAKRAVWLGNDETHYVRKWEGRNLSDMKKLIDLTLHWIEAEVLTESFLDEMPD